MSGNNYYPTISPLVARLRGWTTGGSADGMSPEQAYQTLMEWTGEDFGYDADAWDDWISSNDIETVHKGLFAKRKQERDNDCES